MEPIVEGNPSPSVPEAGTSNPLKSLCDPISTTPTLKSGQIVYGCAFLLGEPGDFSLVTFRDWQDGQGVGVLAAEESCRCDGPSWGGQCGGGVTRGLGPFGLWS